MKKFTHIVVFDGTSAYIIPSENLKLKNKENNIEVLSKYESIDEAKRFCEIVNKIITTSNLQNRGLFNN